MPSDSTPSEPSPFWTYLQARLDDHGWSARDFERHTGTHRSRLTRWRQGDGATIENCRILAETFGRPILEVLVASRLLTAAEAQQQPQARAVAADLSDDELLGEVRRRMTTPRIRATDTQDTTRYTTTPTRRSKAHSSDRA